MSSTPSLVPRGWLIEALLSGVCMAVGYALGAFVGWAYRALGLPDLPAPARRTAWRSLAVVAVVGLLATGWFGRTWQAEQRELLGMDTSVPGLWLAGPLLGLVVAVLLVAVARAVKALGRLLFRPLGRVLPPRVAWLVAIVATGLLTWLVLSGLLVGNALSFADSVFAGNNDDDKPGVVNPRARHPIRRADLEGHAGRASGARGAPSSGAESAADTIARVVGDQGAEEPVRAFVGLESAATPTERARLAVAELRALGGFDRGAIAVAGTTGSGWIDPRAADALEYATHGDVATVSTQYSYLPSWLSFLVDRSRAASNAEQLITALRVELDGMPADSRPELYVYGESLGAFSTGNAFTSVEDMSTTTDGALLIGPPSFDTDLAEGRRRPRARLAGVEAALRWRRASCGSPPRTPTSPIRRSAGGRTTRSSTSPTPPTRSSRGRPTTQRGSILGAPT